MKILVLGSSGTVGTALEAVCKQREIQCSGLTHKDLEITDKEVLTQAIHEYNPDVVINAMVMMGINPCEAEPLKAFQVNAVAVYNLAKLCNERDMVLVQPSTHAVFNGEKDDYYTEEDRPDPLNVYGLSKYTAEYLVRNTCRKHYIVRFPTLFGRRRNSSLGFVDKVLKRIAEGQELKIADDKIDSPTYTRDAADRVISLLKEGKPFGLYHIANSGKVSYYDFVAKIIEITGVPAKLSRAKSADFPSQAPNPLKTALKSVKLESLRPWPDSLGEYLSEEEKI